MDFDEFVAFFLVKIGLKPDEFYSMSLSELVLSARAWQYKEDLEWDRARHIMTYIHNGSITANAYISNKGKYFKTPKDVRMLYGEFDSKPKTSLKDSFEKAKLLEDKAVKAGLIKPKGERKSLKEIFKAD